MLPRSQRLHRSGDFTEVVRRGRRCSRSTLTVHVLIGRADDLAPARAGLVVSKAVGGSVVRHTVARRLRHLLADHLGQLPSGTRVVVRAAPPAATAGSDRLGRDLDEALARARTPRRPAAGP